MQIREKIHFAHQTVQSYNSSRKLVSDIVTDKEFRRLKRAGKLKP